MQNRLIIFFFLNFLTLTLSPAIHASDASTASDPNLIPLEIFFDNPEKVSPLISPDGTKLAYIAPDSENILNIWIRDLKTKRADQQVTTDKNRGIRGFAWQYDSQHLLYAQDKDGDENWHVYQVNIDKRELRDLTPFDGAVASILAYGPKFPNQMLVMCNVRDSTLFDVYRLNLDTAALTIEFENRENYMSFAVDHQLAVRAASSYDVNGDTVIKVRKGAGEPWKEILRCDRFETGEFLQFSADDKALFIVTDKGSDTINLRKYTFDDGSVETVVSDSNYDFCVSSGGVETINHPQTGDLEAVKIVREKGEWIIINPVIKNDLALLDRKGSEMSIISRDLNDRKWVVKYISDRKAPHYYLYDRTSKESQFLFSANSKLDRLELSEMKPIAFKARDGMQLYGYLTLPVDKTSKNLPTVLFVHGGPWVRDVWGFSPYVQWFASRGYAVLQVNYRGSTGYGKKYLNAGNREWAGKMQDDLLDGKQWLIDQGIADADKVGIFGGSYGGYAVLVGMTFTPQEFCCGVDIVGPSNIVTLLETIPSYWDPMRAIFDVRVGRLDTEKEFLESRSPLFKADQIVRPLLIAQGANDPRVKQSESDQIVAAMQKNGQEVMYLLYPDEGHGFARPENRLDFCRHAEVFLNKHLNGATLSK